MFARVTSKILRREIFYLMNQAIFQRQLRYIGVIRHGLSYSFWIIQSMYKSSLHFFTIVLQNKILQRFVCCKSNEHLKWPTLVDHVTNTHQSIVGSQETVTSYTSCRTHRTSPKSLGFFDDFFSNIVFVKTNGIEIFRGYSSAPGDGTLIESPF